MRARLPRPDDYYECNGCGAYIVEGESCVDCEGRCSLCDSEPCRCEHEQPDSVETLGLRGLL